MSQIEMTRIEIIYLFESIKMSLQNKDFEVSFGSFGTDHLRLTLAKLEREINK